MSVLGIFLFWVFLIIGAAAVDIAWGFRARAMLQNAADSTAHAALYEHELNPSATESKELALKLLQTSMPESVFGPVETENDIEFGTWDADTYTLTPDTYSKDAVRVTANFLEARENGLNLFLMRLLGDTVWDARAQAVAETYRPTCFREGFVADDVVDLQSNNGYYNGFCIHSNKYVKVSSNNYFEAGTVVSMPKTSDLELPKSGFETNDGLLESLRSGTYRMRILKRLPDIIDDLDDTSSDYMPDYITKKNVKTLTPKAKKVGVGDFSKGYVHTYSCGGKKGSITLESGTYNEIVFVTDCAIKLQSGVILDDVILATSSKEDKSVSSPSGLQIGKDDHCAEDGGAQVLTLGGFDVAADLKVFGGQVLAWGDIAFSANANGIEVASFVSYGTISGTSNMTMGFCGSGMEDNFEADYFRLVQ